MNIRAEYSSDFAAVYAINVAAFESNAEAKLVEALRLQASPAVSLVAQVEGNVVGHIMFSSVTLVDDDGEQVDVKMMGLAPMAVSAEYQRQGIGSALVREGLQVCRLMGVEAVVVLGHAEYYPRFGFAGSDQFGITCEYDVPAKVFMVAELKTGALEGKSGAARYHAAFGAL